MKNIRLKLRRFAFGYHLIFGNNLGNGLVTEHTQYYSEM